MDSKVAKQLLISLFEELNIPLTNYEIEEIEKYHLTEKETSEEKIRRLIINLLPQGKKKKIFS